MRNDLEIEFERGLETSSSPRDNEPLRIMDVMKLRAELDEMTRGNLTLGYIEGYDSQELLFLCKEAARSDSEAHEILVPPDLWAECKPSVGWRLMSRLEIR